MRDKKQVIESILRSGPVDFLVGFIVAALLVLLLVNVFKDQVFDFLIRL